jgi:hypothetical protein
MHSDRTTTARSIMRFAYDDESGFQNSSLYCIQREEICNEEAG